MYLVSLENTQGHETGILNMESNYKPVRHGQLFWY